MTNLHTFNTNTLITRTDSIGIRIIPILNMFMFIFIFMSVSSFLNVSSSFASHTYALATRLVGFPGSRSMGVSFNLGGIL
jgi:hypothetical protein